MWWFLGGGISQRQGLKKSWGRSCGGAGGGACTPHRAVDAIRQMLVSQGMMVEGEPYELKVRESLLGALMAI